MNNIFLAINLGSHGWQLEPCKTAFEALVAAKSGQAAGNEWKIVRELRITVDDDNKEGENETN